MNCKHMANHLLILISNSALCSSYTDYKVKFTELSVYITHPVILFWITIQDQCTPLHIASHNGHSSIVEVLIKAEADVNAVAVVSCFV